MNKDDNFKPEKTGFVLQRLKEKKDYTPRKMKLNNRGLYSCVLMIISGYKLPTSQAKWLQGECLRYPLSYPLK